MYYYCSSDDLANQKVYGSSGDVIGEFLDWYELRELEEEEIDDLLERKMQEKMPEVMEELKLLREENKKMKKKIRSMKYKLYGR